MNASTSKLNTFLDNFMGCIHDAVLVLLGEKIVFANKSVERILGYKCDELVGQSLNILIPDRFQKTHEKLLRKTTDTPYVKLMSDRSVLTAVNKKGEEIPVAVTIAHTEYDGVGYNIAVVRDVSLEVEKFQNIVDIAEHDALTGLGNRLFLSKQMAVRKNNTKQGYALLFMDLNRFKPINDRYGHNVGDRVLRIVARRIRNCIRPQDIPVRLGGDEFVVLIDAVRDRVTLQRIAEDISATLSKPMRVDGNYLKISVAIGCSIYPDSAKDESKLLEIADKAMYNTKRQVRELDAVC